MKNSFKLTIRIGVIIALFLNYNSMYGQYYPALDYFNSSACSETLDLTNYSASTTYDFENAIPKVYNVHFYGLELTSGSYTDADRLTEELALERIAQLNIAFNPYKIFFKYRGIDFYSELIPNGPCQGQELATADSNCMGNRMPEVIDDDDNENKINIILHHPGTCNNYKGEADIYEKTLSFKYCTFGGAYVIYQMGHLFGLFKTQRGTAHSGSSSDPNYETIQQDPYCDNPDFPYPFPYNDNANGGGGYLFIPDFNTSVGITENVTRDSTNPYYNAATAGDYVTDTPACFKGSGDNYCHDYDATYEFLEHPDIVDNSPDQIMYVDVDILNIMHFYWKPRLTSILHFTDGQGVRMRETIAIPSLNFDEIETTVASLYEPYKELFDVNCSTNYDLDTYYADIPDEDPRNIKLNSNLTFRAIEDPDPIQGCVISYFQPGFDYEIYRCRVINLQGDTVTGDLLFTYDKYSFIPLMFQICGKQIKILQLDGIGDCHHPYLDNCPIDIEPLDVVNGSLYMHQNNNYSSQALDSIQINHVDFYQNLPNGIHTINIQTNTGEVIQKTILKDNE